MDEEFQIIVSQHVTASSPDVRELEPVVERIKKALGKRPDVVLADAGYWSESNVRFLQGKSIEPLIAPHRTKHGDAVLPPPRGRTPSRLTLKERMARKLHTLNGRAEYAKRKVIVEPVFGQIKQARGFRQFLRRGVENVGHEWSIVSTAHNILKLFRAMAMA